jgi:hypothetical protein
MTDSPKSLPADTSAMYEAAALDAIEDAAGLMEKHPDQAQVLATSALALATLATAREAKKANEITMQQWLPKLK